MDLGFALTLAFVASLWIAAVAFGSDSRDGRDWAAGTSPRERPHRTGD